MRSILISCTIVLLATVATAQQLTTPTAPNGPFREELRLNENPANPGALNNSGNTNRNTGRTTWNFGNVFIAGYVSEENSGQSVQTEIYVNISRDNGRTWSLPVQVSPTDGFATDQPKVFVGPDPLNPGGLIFNVVCEDGRKGMGDFPDDVRSFWSTDGVVWTEATYLSGQPGVNPQAGICGNCAGGQEYDVDEARAAWSNDGILHIIGEDQGRQTGCPGDGGESVWYARSPDGGRTIEAARWLDNVVLGTTCQASDVDSPELDADGQTVVLAWSDNTESQNAVPGAAGDDLWVAASIDGGVNFVVTVAETNSAGGEAGDTDEVAVDVSEVMINGVLERRVALLYIDNEAAAGGADSVTLVTSADGGFTWSAEKDVDPMITATANAGAAYLNVIIAEDTLVTGYCSDWNAATINGSAPAFGNNDDFREAFVNVSNDFGVTFNGAVDLDVPAGGAPNRANNELFLKSDGLTIIAQYQLNPFGSNDDAWNWSADGGFTWAGTQVVFSSFLGDVDRGNTQDNWLSVNWDDLSVVSIYGLNTTGQNEDYIIGLKFPFVTSTAGTGNTIERLGLGGVFLPSSGESFVVGVGLSGNAPATPLGGDFLLPLAVDTLTLLTLNDPTLLPLVSGAINSGSLVSDGQASPFPAPIGASLSAAGVRLAPNGTILGTTDGVTLNY